MSTILRDEILPVITLSPDQTVRHALSVICESGAQIAIVSDVDSGRMLATVTDGDIRRALLRSTNLEDPISDVMNVDFAFVPEGAVDKLSAEAMLRSKGIRHLPELDDDGRLLKLHMTFHLDPPSIVDIPVVIMAGGKGSRLRPLTNDTPKPLLKLGGKPILERILINLVTQGFRRFFFSVNYLAEQIENYFGDGSRWGADIRYVHEARRLGTAGALGEIQDKIDTPLIVQNGDLITDFQYAELVEAHRSAGAVATMGLRKIYTQVEFGVVEVEGGLIQSIVEKPSIEHLVNGGIYCLDPKVLERVVQGRYLDMPTLFTDLMDAGDICHGFPIPKSWLDIGTHAELERARSLYSV